MKSIYYAVMCANNIRIEKASSEKDACWKAYGLYDPSQMTIAEMGTRSPKYMSAKNKEAIYAELRERHARRMKRRDELENSKDALRMTPEQLGDAISMPTLRVPSIEQKDESELWFTGGTSPQLCNRCKKNPYHVGFRRNRFVRDKDIHLCKGCAGELMEAAVKG